MTRAVRFLIVAFVVLVISGPAQQARAHAFNPALLELTEVEAGRFSVAWKRPTRGQQVPDLSVIVPDHCQTEGSPARTLQPESLLERWQIDCGVDGLAGYELGVEGPALERLEVVTLVMLDDGTAVRRALRAGDSTVVIVGENEASLASSGYLALGVEHILLGLDHLLFVLGLTLLVRGHRRLLSTITAFTVGHSVTLCLVALGYLILPSRPVESLIALSILLLAVELAQRRLRENRSDSRSQETSLTEKHPWAVAAGFGLVHGAGFAGALAEVGLPPDEIPTTLLIFNMGIEVGQLLFVAFVVATLTLLKRIAPSRHAAVQASLYLPIGGLAMFWIIDRTSDLWAHL